MERRSVRPGRKRKPRLGAILGGVPKENFRVADIDPIVEAVRADLLRRSQFGIAKYGVTLARTDLNLRDWLQHVYEETLDQANYLKRAIVELDQSSATNPSAVRPE